MSWFWEQGSFFPVTQTLMRRWTDGWAVITPCDTCFAGGQPRAWESVPGMYVCGGCGCGCVRTHPSGGLGTVEGSENAACRVQLSTCSMNNGQMTKPSRAPPTPAALPSQTHPRQASQARPASLSPWQHQEEDFGNTEEGGAALGGMAWSRRSEALPTLL